MTRMLSLIAVFALSACGGVPSDDELEVEAWDAIQGYESWGQVSTWQGIQPSGRAHGAFVQNWFNPTALDNHGSTIPDGGIAVKENYDASDATAPNKIFVMYKVDGYDDANGDWFYARYGPDGSVDAAGQAAVEGCAGCHNAGDSVDRLLTARDAPATDGE